MKRTNLSEPVTVPSLERYKKSGTKLVALTAYDFTTARILDRAGVDLLLVGDSVASVFQGEKNTLPVTLEQMAYHCRCVTRGVERALVIGDMPFLSYQPSAERAIESAGMLLKEGGVSAVKLEGGIHVAETIRRIVEVDIPVVGHIGLTPQSYHRMGGHKKQGRKGEGSKAGSKERVIEDALAVQESGAFLIVLEGIPADLASELTELLEIPTIGIGAGKGCDGQILVVNDMLGCDPDFTPSFVKQYANLYETIQGAVSSYCEEVRSGEFPPDSKISSSNKKLSVAK